MAKSTVRVELCTPREEIYRKLLIKMAEAQFENTMAIQEKRFILPRGEFTYENNAEEIKELLEKATLISRTVSFHYRWHNLGVA